MSPLRERMIATLPRRILSTRTDERAVRAVRPLAEHSYTSAECSNKFLCKHAGQCPACTRGWPGAGQEVERGRIKTRVLVTESVISYESS